MSAVVVGTVLIAGSVALLAFALLASSAPRISKDRRTVGPRGPEDPLWRVVYRGFTRLVDRMMSSSGWNPFRASELEMADVRMPASTLVSRVAMGMAASLAVGLVLGRSIWLGVFLALMTPVATKVYLRHRAGKRRRLFAKQLDGVLQMLASSLRAGQSFPQALDSCAREASSPMSDELARIVNESRLGRDMINAMEETSERMDCEDFVWLAEAVALTRDSGGNLNEIIDRVAETIRERTEIREKVHAFASEGRISAYVLMSLPIFVGVAYSFTNPGYLDPLFTTGLGRVLLLGSAVMFVISYFWMRAIVNVKV